MSKTLGRSLLQWQVVARAQAGIDGERDRKRHRRFFIEDGNRLIAPILLKDEIILLKSCYRRTVCIRDRDVYKRQYRLR